MKTLKECVEEAAAKKVAIGHFNVSNLEAVWAIFRAAKNLSVPVIIGVSEGERDFVGVRQIAAIVRSIREEYDYPIFINADHTYSYEKVKEAIDAGFDSVIFDGAGLPFEENLKICRQCVQYAKNQSREVLIEGELGYIGTSSKILDELPKGVSILPENLTKPDEAKKFVRETGVDMLAPAVGNIHGMFKGGKDPALNIEVIKAVSEATGVPLVLHGGSGNSSQDFRAAIAAGVRIVHINTELRAAFRKALQLSLQENPEELSPYKYLRPTINSMEKLVDEKLKIFNNLS